MRQLLFPAMLTLAIPCAANAQVRRVGDLNTRQIAALDRAKTVVILQGGMLEEHGPYLPAYTDGLLSSRLADDVAQAIAARRPDWTVLVFPQIAVGASGYNEAGGHYTFPGTYAVRPSTLRAIFMDLASQLGEQGFRWVMVVHVHGSPMHIGPIDDAGDFFHDTYGGTMVNLWGLLPVLGGWGAVLDSLPADIKREDGLSLHAGLDEHSLMLFLDSARVSPDYRRAPTMAGANYDSSFAVARRAGWPGYIGAPRLATAAIGRRIWTGFSGAAQRVALEILGGADPAQYRRYMSYLMQSPNYAPWIAEAARRDSLQGEAQRAWRSARTAPR